MTHTDLVERAYNWLRVYKSCSVIVTEMSSGAGESPDAIGWRFGMSWLVECKASRADFLADRAKHFRRNPGTGMGRHRYFMCEPGMIARADLPADWGLLHPKTRGVLVAAEPMPQAFDARREAELLCSCLRRTLCQPDVRGVRCKTYVFEGQGEPRATICAETE